MFSLLMSCMTPCYLLITTSWNPTFKTYLTGPFPWSLLHLHANRGYSISLLWTLMVFIPLLYIPLLRRYMTAIRPGGLVTQWTCIWKGAHGRLVHLSTQWESKVQSILGLGPLLSQLSIHFSKWKRLELIPVQTPSLLSLYLSNCVTPQHFKMFCRKSILWSCCRTEVFCLDVTSEY